MSDDDPEPERFSCEWHARECDSEADGCEARAALAYPELSTDLLWVGPLRDRAEKLRQAEIDADFLSHLRMWADQAQQESEDEESFGAAAYDEESMYHIVRALLDTPTDETYWLNAKEVPNEE